ncbi:MAG: hypothetical protein JNG83_14675 [Opitutaceae bacterium]|nr:hypothetical protein [Opitutaceae bacterium]
MSVGVISAYIPASWFHARGIHKVLHRLLPRLPDVSSKLFLTFTVNPALYDSPADAFEQSRDRLRRIFFRLKKGVEWEGKRYQLDAPYCVKVEFHRSGWAHFHVIFLTTRFLPGALLNHLWGLGRTNVQRINNRDFHYLLKYVTKGGGLPEWILSRKRLRIFQPSRGFLRSVEVRPSTEKEKKRPVKRRSTVLGQRLDEWGKSAKFRQGDRVARINLSEPFKDVFDRNVFPAASEGRYLGNGHILISDTTQLIPWITNQSQQT